MLESDEGLNFLVLLGMRPGRRQPYFFFHGHALQSNILVAWIRMHSCACTHPHIQARTYMCTCTLFGTCTQTAGRHPPLLPEVRAPQAPARSPLPCVQALRVANGPPLPLDGQLRGLRQLQGLPAVPALWVAQSSTCCMGCAICTAFMLCLLCGLLSQACAAWAAPTTRHSCRACFVTNPVTHVAPGEAVLAPLASHVK